jgi:hypothetical protein
MCDAMQTYVAFLGAFVVFGNSVLAGTHTVEGKFGRAVIDAERPSVTTLVLRRADGSLEPQSLLSPKGFPWLRGMPDWGTEALTFAVDESGRRFESRNRAPEAVEKTANGVTLRGVVLTDGRHDAVAREDWNLKREGDAFVWTVERTWLRDLTVTSTGTPALFFSSRPINSNPSTILPNSVATAFWVAPEKLRGWHNPFYRPAEFGFSYKLALENNVVVTEPGGWAVLKLFPAWPHESEPRFAVEGGHLYRRGFFGWLSEVGIASWPDARRTCRAGEKEKTTLRITAVPAGATGHQLAVRADDPSGTVDALRRFYGALFNGGCVNDQLHYNFGNEPDGWYYGGASWMKGLPLLAGAPAPQPTASRPHDLARAFRDNLPMIAGTEFEPGLTRFGYNSAGHGAVGGAYTDDNIIQILGGRAYYLYSGDLAFVRQQLPFYRRAAAWYLGKRNADGLVSLAPAHWYYDAMLASGVTTYHNAFLYRAIVDLAQLERAAGNLAEAAARETEAARLKEAINRVLWWEDAPGGPRYCDWIQPDGTKIAYAADLCQFPPVAFGIASPEQGRKLLATLDRRIAELERDFGYRGLASRSAYWPVPASVNTHPVNQGFGSYMNGGSFLCMTYWEVMARCAAGDAEGAWNRLRRFAAGTRLTGTHGYIGNNWVMHDGRIGAGACDEPYLSDAIAVPAALVQGILGIRHTNERLEVRPVLPSALSRATAEVVHLGVRKRVTIDGRNVKVEDLGRVFTPPRELTWRVTAGCPPEANLDIDRTFATGRGWTATPEIAIRGGQGLSLRRVPTSPLAGLWKLDDEPGEAVANGSEYEAAGTRHGNVALRAPDRHGKPAAARFQGGAQIVVGNIEPFTFQRDQSFTVQAWFQTSSQENQVIAARPGAFSLGVKGGKLSAWIMQDGGQFVEATGKTVAADGKWHHAAAVYDRHVQELTVYLDGKPDGEPKPIAGIGVSTSNAPLTLGAFGGGFPFDGSLDEIAIHRVALKPEQFAFAADYAAVPPARLGAQAGRYATATCDWGQSVRVTALRTIATLHDGAITAQVETSHDDFKTLAATAGVVIPTGEHAAKLPDLPPARYARVVVTLATAAEAAISPLLQRIELLGEPLP